MLSAEATRCRTALADLAFGDASCVRAAVAQLGAHDAWDDLVALAARWHVAGHLKARIAEVRDVPEAARARLRSLAAASSAHSTLTLRRAVPAATLLEAAGIPTLAIKGIAAVADLYRGTGERLAGDFDCVVRERDARRAEDVLLANGFVSHNIPFAQHLAQIEVSPRLHNHARTYSKDGLELDLHWRLGTKPPAPLLAGTLLERSTTVDIAGGTLRVPHPVDAQLIAVHHSMRGGYVPATTLKDLTDLAAWWNRRPGAWDPDELIEAAMSAGLGDSLLALWAAIAARDPEHAAARGSARFSACLGSKERRAAERLRRYFEIQLAEGEFAPRTIEMFSLPRLGIRGATEVRARWRDRERNREHFATRAAAFTRRSLRVARELSNPRRLLTFATVARVQRRYR